MARQAAAMLLAGMCALAGPPPAKAADLDVSTAEAYANYVQLTEKQIGNGLAAHAPFLWVESLPTGKRAEVESCLRVGEVVIERLDARDRNSGNALAKPISVPGGMIHHWIGTVFIPGATLAETLAFEQDYDHHASFFEPDVQRSKILQHERDDFVVQLRFERKKLITAVFDTEHEGHYHFADATHAWSRSRTTRIREVDDPGGPHERLEPEGHDRGFLWRMNTYWRFEGKNDGVYVECQSVSLTRDIPTGLGWLIGAYVTSVPRESLTFTLATTRSAVLQRISRRASTPGPLQPQAWSRFR